MGLLDLFKRAKRGDRTKTPGEMFAEQYPYLDINYNGVDVEGQKCSWRLPSAYRALNLRAGIIGSFPVHIYRPTDSGREKAIDHRWYKALRRKPNRYETAPSFFRQCELDRKYEGNCYILVRRKTVEVVRLNPQKTRRVVDEDGKHWVLSNDVYDDALTVFRGKGKGKDKEPDVAVYSYDDVIHLRSQVTSLSPINGLAIDDLFRLTIGLAVDVERYQSDFTGSAYINKIYLSTDQTLGKEKREEAAESARGFLRKVGSKYRTTMPVLSGGTKVQHINLTPEEMALIETRADLDRAIANICEVPVHLINSKEKPSYNSLEMTNLAFLAYDINPTLIDYAAEFNSKLFTEAELDEGLYVEHKTEMLLQLDAKTRIEVMSKGVLSGINMPNENRQALNLPEVSGGDVLLLPTNMQSAQYLKDKQRLEIDRLEALAAEGVKTPEDYLRLYRDLAARHKPVISAAQQSTDANTYRSLIVATIQAVGAEVAEGPGINVAQLADKYADGATVRLERQQTDPDYETHRLINATAREVYLQQGVKELRWVGQPYDGVVKPILEPFATDPFAVTHPPVKRDGNYTSWIIPN